MIYGNRSNGSQHGLVLTKPVVVNAMLDRVGYTPHRDLSQVKVIEPAAGDGAFAVAIIDRLYASSVKHGFSFEEALFNLTFFEIDKSMAKRLTKRIEFRLNEYATSFPKDLIRKEDYLLSSAGKCDLVVGNPPYVRHENIPGPQRTEYRKRFATFTYRSDLYIAFYEKGLRQLNDRGTLTYICSNRWLKNQYGRNLRKLVGLSFSVEEIIDMEETSPFEENVIAYPAITTMHKSGSKRSAKYYRIDDLDDLSKIDKKVRPVRTLSLNNSVNWFSYQLNGSNHERFLDSIEHQGFKIGIGVATGSDKVFIRQDFLSLVEEELLIPIITSKDLKNNEINWTGNYIINPYDVSGGLIDLSKYPKAEKYFNSNRGILQKRHVAKKNPYLWYKTIDRITPRLTNCDKILLPDISGNTHLFIDHGNYYPHHNLYYITGQNRTKLILLAAVLMSDFVKNQLSDLGNKMNGGYPRWQSQNLRKLKVPILDAIPSETAQSIAEAYHQRDYKAINKLIAEDKIAGYTFTTGQAKLFEPGSENYQTKT